MVEQIAILVVSLCLIGVGVVRLQKNANLLTAGKIAKATIYKNTYRRGSRHRSGSDSGVYHPVVRFLTDNQEWITQELSVGYLPAKKEGTKLEVRYDPEDPTNVEINSVFQLEVLPRLFVGIGVFGLVFLILELLDFTHIMA